MCAHVQVADVWKWVHKLNPKTGLQQLEMSRLDGPLGCYLWRAYYNMAKLWMPGITLVNPTYLRNKSPFSVICFNSTLLNDSTLDGNNHKLPVLGRQFIPACNRNFPL